MKHGFIWLVFIFLANAWPNFCEFNPSPVAREEASTFCTPSPLEMGARRFSFPLAEVEVDNNVLPTFLLQKFKDGYARTALVLFYLAIHSKAVTGISQRSISLGLSVKDVIYPFHSFD